MQRLVKDAKYDSLYPAARAQLSSWRGKGAMQAFLDLEEVEQRMFIDVSLAELAAYVLWRTSIRVRPFRVKRCKPDSARSELLQRRRTPELRLQDEWGQLASEEKRIGQLRILVLFLPGRIGGLHSWPVGQFHLGNQTIDSLRIEELVNNVPRKERTMEKLWWQLKAQSVQ